MLSVGKVKECFTAILTARWIILILQYDIVKSLIEKVVYDAEFMKTEFGLENEKEIKDKIWKEIKEINKKMPTYKYIKELIVTQEEFIKTTTQKIKRFEELKKLGIEN